MGPKVTNPDGTLQYSARRFPSMIAAIFRHTLFGKLFPNNRFVRDYLMTNWTHDDVIDVGWVSGAAMLIRREMIDEIGLFDERFFMYCEDMDICKRAHDKGWRVVYYPFVNVIHRIGASSDHIPIAMIKQHHKSMMLYYFKHYAKSPRILLAPFVVLGLWIRCRSIIHRARRDEMFKKNKKLIV